jgi:tetratricopeptide (TPR) repeat protein
MFEITRPFARLLAATALLFALCFSAARAQDSALEEIKYKEDYDRVQTLLKITDIVKRTDRAISMYKDRRDMNEELRTYLDALFVRDLDALMKQQNFAALKSVSDRVLKARPRFGEVYLYQGIVLKNEKNSQDAMVAFARGFVIKNPLQSKCKQQLDLLFRAARGGSLIGQEKFIKESMKDLK